MSSILSPTQQAQLESALRSFCGMGDLSVHDLRDKVVVLRLNMPAPPDVIEAVSSSMREFLKEQGIEVPVVILPMEMTLEEAVDRMGEADVFDVVRRIRNARCIDDGVRLLRDNFVLKRP